MAGLLTDQSAKAEVSSTHDDSLDRFAQHLLGDENEDGEESQESEEETPEGADENEEPEETEEGSEESEGDEGETEGEDEETEQPASKEPQTIEIDGEQIPLEEAKKGFLRNRDYTQKTQKLAEERRAFEAESTAVKTERARYGQLLDALEAQIQANEPLSQFANINWEELRQTDPIEYGVKMADYTRVVQKLQAVQGEKARLTAVQQDENRKLLDQRIADEGAKLLDAIPAWKDPAKKAEELPELVKFGKDIGFTDAELENVIDHRAIKLLHDAWRYNRAMQAKKPVAQQKVAAAKKAPTLTPGTSKPASPSLTRDKLRKRLSQTGSVEDAAALFATL